MSSGSPPPGSVLEEGEWEMVSVRSFCQKMLESLDVDAAARTHTTNEELDATDLSFEDVLLPTSREQIDQVIKRQLLPEHEVTSTCSTPTVLLPPSRGKRRETNQGTKAAPCQLEPGLIQRLQEAVPTFQQLATHTNNSLATLRFVRKREQSRKTLRKEVNYITSLMQQPEENKHFDPVSRNDVILTVAFYHAQKAMKVQEFRVLGSQVLTDLRDRLYCLSDSILDGPQCKSGYFFIENVFYNDMRVAGSIDYSKNVIDWVNEKERYNQANLARFVAKSMADTKFMDLTIRLGVPYSYVHQGNCEHAVVFTDIRLIDSHDHQNRNDYPQLSFQAKIRRRKCRICDLYPAKWVTYGDRVSTENPSFWCEHCYNQAHYLSTNPPKLLYTDYEVFPYYHE